MKIVRFLLACLVLLTGLAVLSYLQKRFDEADIRKALEVAHKKFPEALNCEARVTSRIRGEVEVICQGGSWKINLVKGVIGGIHGTTSEVSR